MANTIGKILALILYLMVISGCKPEFTQSHNPTLAKSELNDDFFVSFDGTRLPLRSWNPAGGTAAADAIFIALHGFNDYSRFIENGAEFFSRHNTAVFAYDQRGFGNAPLRGRWSSKETMGWDLKTLISLIKKKHPDIPLYLLGHSMGGALVINSMSGENHTEIAGAVLIAPAVWARSTMPFYQPVALWVAAHTLPGLTATGRGLRRTACNNRAILREQSRDPLVIKDTRFDTIYGLQDLMDAAYANADRFTLPTLMLYGRHDEIIPAEPVLSVYDRFPSTPDGNKRLNLYEKGYHMLLRDLEAEETMQDILVWVHRSQGQK